MKQFIAKRQTWVFILCILIIFFVFDYFTLVFREPFGIHFIRQTDSLSFVSNYYKNGFHFFEPQIFNHQSVDGKTACEFPILYFLTAVFYLFFGENDFILRCLTLFISSIGFVYSFKLMSSFIEDVVVSILFSLLLISSPILLFYSNNYLPDASVLAFTMIAWYHFFKFYKDERKLKNLTYCFLFFALASLIKVTYFIYPFSAFLFLFSVKLIENKHLVKSIIKTKYIWYFFFTQCVLVLSWNMYVLSYNKSNNASYFLTEAKPIWKLTQLESKTVWDHIFNHWFSQYYYPSLIHTLSILFLVGLIFMRFSNRLFLLCSFILLGCSMYFLLFFEQFKYHDYYFIVFIPLFFFLTIVSYENLFCRKPKFFVSPIFKIFLFVLLLISLKHTHKKLAERFDYHKPDLFADIGKKLSHTKQFLDQKSIPSNAKFIIYTDLTPNGGLYFINRPGWNVNDNSLQSKEHLKSFLSNNPDYIIFTKKEYIISEITEKKIGIENGNYIYKLKKNASF